MAFWTYQNIADVTQGTWLVEPEDLGAEVTGLWHDTREIKEGQAYLAIKGDNFDGHDFIDKAFDAGAALAIVSTDPSSLEGGVGGRVPSPRNEVLGATDQTTRSGGSPRLHPGHPILLVPDTVVALQDLARAYRDELKAGGCKVIGIAGSNGKTTTRHLIHHVLTHAGLEGTQSPKSFNNHLGVPLTLLSAKPGHGFVACEIGTNHPGEIDFLSAIARPDIAVITSIGEEHLEFFKDLEGVAKEELSIIDRVENHGHVVLGRLPEWRERAIDLAGTRVSIHDYFEPENDPPINNKLLGLHNQWNAAATASVARLMEARFPEWYEALQSAEPSDHRGELIEFGQRLTVIDDCYNANPDSMKRAIAVLEEHADLYEGNRGVAILGDMFELGERATESHREVGFFAQDNPTNIGLMICIGEHANTTANAYGLDKSVVFSEWTDGLPEQVAALLQPGDTVLLKASRGMRLERLIPAIERRFGPAQGNEPT
ncbi:MAG: UDP-N-acetylmuramoyl-tripeptide--D-alanyl-D-alanine ligase [Planctomycetota bacterium]